MDSVSILPWLCNFHHTDNISAAAEYFSTASVQQNTFLQAWPVRCCYQYNWCSAWCSSWQCSRSTADLTGKKFLSWLSKCWSNTFLWYNNNTCNNNAFGKNKCRTWHWAGVWTADKTCELRAEEEDQPQGIVWCSKDLPWKPCYRQE